MTDLQPRQLNFESNMDSDSDSDSDMDTDSEAQIFTYEKLQPQPLSILENVEEITKIDSKCYDILHTEDNQKISIHEDVQEHLAKLSNDISDLRKNLSKPGTIDIFRAKMSELDSYKLEVKDKIEEIKKMKESLEYKQIFKYIDEENDDSNKFILIIPGEEYISDDEILCFSENSINKIIRNYREWLIECTGQQLMDDQGQPTDDKSIQIKESPEFYVGLPIDSDGMLGFVDIRQVKTLSYLVKNGLNFCYLVPTDEMISHTVSLKNVYGNYPDWVSEIIVKGVQIY